MKLEWDEKKRSKSFTERKLDFADIASIDWETALTVEDTRADYGEVRYVTMTKIKGRLCVFAWCWRNGNLRVISLRKTKAKERSKYEKALLKS